MRWLHFNNGAVETVMSLDDPNRLVLDYVRAMMAVLVFVPHTKNMLNLGLGGGAIHRFCNRYLPETRILTIEADPLIVDLCSRYFYLQDRMNEIVVVDAIDFLENLHRSNTSQTPTSFDAILVDLFAEDGVANCLLDPDFYPLVKSSLDRNGVIIFNFIFRNETDLENVFAHIWKEYNGKVVCFKLDECNNVLIIAFGSEAIDRRIQTIYNNANYFLDRIHVNFSNYVDLLIQYNGVKNGKLKYL